MRALVFFMLLIICDLPSVANPGAVPEVPGTIEIAGVKLKLTSDARREIQKDVNALRASDRYFQIKLDRVNLYFPIIERVLKEEGVPEDLKYLSIQESALISDAVSSADAVGYWQFKDFTAREVGLRVDGKVDERKNIVSATRGAAKYFKRNNYYFKNWIYSVSAYQAGPGGAKKYVDKNNFGSNKLTITSNHHWYVLRFIAHVIAFKEEVGGSHSEGLKLAEYTKGAGKTLGQIANQYKVDDDLVKDYNKWLKHGRIPDDKDYTVIIPIKGKVPKNLNEDDELKPLTRTITSSEPEPVKYPNEIASNITQNKQAIPIKINGIEALMAGKGDNIVSLALKGGISSDRLIKYNDLMPGQPIEAGNIYYIKRKRNRSPIRFHVANHEESLWDISQKYGVKLKKLARKNRMEPTDEVKAGRVMWLRKKRPKKTPVEYHQVTPTKQVRPKPTAKPLTRSAEPKEKPETPTEEPPRQQIKEEQPSTKKEVAKILHVVQQGQTLWSLSQRYQVTVDQIIYWNDLSTGTLSKGQELLIYGTRSETSSESDDLTQAKEQQPEKETINNLDFHEVQPGESLWAIAKKYEVDVEQLKKWNGLSGSTINTGQKLQLQQPESPKETVKNEYNTYVVRGGDSLYSIARQHNMTVEQLMEINRMETTQLSVGDELKVVQK